MFDSAPIRRSACGNKGWNSASFFSLFPDRSMMIRDAAIHWQDPTLIPRGAGSWAAVVCVVRRARQSEAQKSNRALRTGAKIPRRVGRGNGSCLVMVPRGCGLARFHAVRALFATFRIRLEADRLPRRVSPLASARAIEDFG